MKRTKRWSAFLVCLFSAFLLTACLGLDDDEAKDKVERLTLYVAPETGTYYDLFDSERKRPMEGMQIRYSEKEKWQCIPLHTIGGFEYTKGYEYVLLVDRTTLANPPADASMYTFKLVKVISKIARWD